MEHKDVASRRTALFIDTDTCARQDITRGRKIFLLGCLIAGLLTIAGPHLASTLVEYFFYNESGLIWAMRRVARELWIIFTVPGVLLIICAIMGLAKRIPVALFDIADGTARFREQRFQALPAWARPQRGEVIDLDDIQSLQIVSYKANQLQYRDIRVDQFELNLVLNDGSRNLISKQPGYESLFDDATRLAEFLDVAVSDHSAQSSRLPA